MDIMTSCGAKQKLTYQCLQSQKGHVGYLINLSKYWSNLSKPQRFISLLLLYETIF